MGNFRACVTRMTLQPKCFNGIWERVLTFPPGLLQGRLRPGEKKIIKKSAILKRSIWEVAVWIVHVTFFSVGQTPYICQYVLDFSLGEWSWHIHGVTGSHWTSGLPRGKVGSEITT